MPVQKPTIVVVDDQPALLHTVASILHPKYQVRPFVSGQIALQFLENQSAALVLLDIDLPGIDGFALARMLRALPKHVHTPIIFLTGNANLECVITAKQSGGNDFMAKPVERNTLLAKIAKWLP